MSYIEQLGKNAQKASKTLISLGSVEKTICCVRLQRIWLNRLR